MFTVSIIAAVIAVWFALRSVMYSLRTTAAAERATGHAKRAQAGGAFVVPRRSAELLREADARFARAEVLDRRADLVQIAVRFGMVRRG